MSVRLARRARLRPDAVEAYRAWHAAVWPEILTLNRAAGVRNYSIFIDGLTLFSFCEVDDPVAAQSLMLQSEAGARWQALMAPFMDAPDPHAPWTPLDEVFHQD